MTKANRTLQIISFVLAGGLLALTMVLMFISLQESREAIKKLNSLDARIISLKQDLKNTKEVLDNKGFTDLNL